MSIWTPIDVFEDFSASPVVVGGQVFRVQLIQHGFYLDSPDFDQQHAAWFALEFPCGRVVRGSLMDLARTAQDVPMWVVWECAVHYHYGDSYSVLEDRRSLTHYKVDWDGVMDVRHSTDSSYPPELRRL